MTPGSPRTSVLVVEDEAILALDLKRMLEASGFEVMKVVADAAAAIEATQALRPSVVLMDVRIEGEPDGITTAEELYVCENTAVVFFSAYSDEESLARATASGAYGYLLKPLAGPVVSAALRIAVRKHEELRALRSSTAWQRAALDQIGTPTIVTDLDGMVSFMNGSATALTGWTLLQARLEGPGWLASILEGPFGPGETEAISSSATLRRRELPAIEVSVRRMPLDADESGVRHMMWRVCPRR